jgi:CheY-like chemotaxis protein
MNPTRPRLLLVDDQEPVRETTAALLGDDFDVTCAPDGFRALELFAKQPFEIICADYNMPGMSGAELLRRARALRPCAAVLVTAHSEFVDAIAPELLQSFAVVLKPYEPQILVDTVNRAHLLLKVNDIKQRRKLA